MQFSSDSHAVTSSSSQTASLPSSPIESILPTATPSIAGTKRGPVPKRRFQKGTFVKRRGNWVGMWRVDTIQPDGHDQTGTTQPDLSRIIRAGGQSEVSTDLGCRQRRKPCEALSPGRPRTPVCESSWTTLLCEQAAGKETTPVARFAGNSAGRLPCVSAWCRYDADRPRRKHYNRRRSTTTQRSKNHAWAVCARRSSIAKRCC